MARRRARTDQNLVRQPAGQHADSATRPSRQTQMAHRARLPGTRAGAGIGPLWRRRLARIPPPRQPVHRRLRVPGQRAPRLFPLKRAAIRPKTSHSTSPIQSLHSTRQPRKGPNGIPKTPSPPCGFALASGSRERCHDVHAACE